MYCAHCGTKNQDGLEGCDRCGELLVRPDPSHPHHLGIKSCPDCKTVNDRHARHCVECGLDIDAVEPVTQVRSPLTESRPARPPRRSIGRPDSPGPTVKRPSPSPAKPSVATTGAGASTRSEDLRKDVRMEAEGPNDSGKPEARLPDDLQGWNWGAFFLPFVWGPFNRVWIGLLGALPGFIPAEWLLESILLGYAPFIFLMGIRGNEWAWRSRRWESHDEFRRVQRSWMTWGAVGFLVLALSVVVVSSGE